MPGNFEVTRVTIEFSVPSASGSGNEKLEMSFEKGHLPNSIFFSETEANAARTVLNVPSVHQQPVRETIKALAQVPQSKPISSVAGSSQFMFFHDGYCDWWFLQ